LVAQQKAQAQLFPTNKHSKLKTLLQKRKETPFYLSKSRLHAHRYAVFFRRLVGEVSLPFKSRGVKLSRGQDSAILVKNKRGKKK
jgi:hypothetical protein